MVWHLHSSERHLARCSPKHNVEPPNWYWWRLADKRTEFLTFRALTSLPQALHDAEGRQVSHLSFHGACSSGSYRRPSTSSVAPGYLLLACLATLTVLDPAFDVVILPHVVLGAT